MIMQIIQMRKTLNEIQDAKRDPLVFMAKQVFAIFGAWIAIILIIEIVILALLGIGGFTTWFGNPSGIARFFFWIFAVGFTGEIILLSMVKRRIMRFLKRSQTTVKETIIDVSAE